MALNGSVQDVYQWAFEGCEDQDAEQGPSQYEHLRGKILVDASCGTAHTAVVTKGGKLMVWGKCGGCRISFLGVTVSSGENDSGQLGTGVDITYPFPTTLTFSGTVHVVQVRCATDHTVCLSQDGSVWTWGCGTLGKLGKSIVAVLTAA